MVAASGPVRFFSPTDANSNLAVVEDAEKAPAAVDTTATLDPVPANTNSNTTDADVKKEDALSSADKLFAEARDCECGENGATQDERRAAELYLQASAMGHAAATCNLGFCFANGVGVDKDAHHAAALYQIAADLGHAEATSNLGLCYDSGTGVEKDERRAAELFRIASDLGHADATYFLGLCYQDGTGVDKDEARAVALFQTASNAEHGEVTFRLGQCYAKGTGAARDTLRAAACYQFAIDEGQHTVATFNLGCLYRDGAAPPRAPSALDCFRDRCGVGADDNGIGGGRDEAAAGIALLRDDHRAAELFQAASDAGHAGATCALAVCYANGAGVAQDLKHAAALFEHASSEGHVVATCHLGMICELGNGAPRDPKRALALYREAAAAGSEWATRAAKRLSGMKI